MSAPRPLAYLPNAISLARLLAVPVTIDLLLQQAYQAAFWLFLAAAVSDAVDGYLAKRFDAVSEIGTYLDPLADKALLVGVFLTLAHAGAVATWLVIAIVFRDVMIIGGALLYHTLTRSLKMEPLFVSKANTLAQILLAGVLLAELGLGLVLPAVTQGLIYLVAATTFVSGAAYVVKWGRRAMSAEGE